MTSGYPPTLPPVNHTAPVPQRIRAVLDGHDAAMLVDEQHQQKLSRGTARRYALQVGEVVRPAALRIYGDDAILDGRLLDRPVTHFS